MLYYTQRNKGTKGYQGTYFNSNKWYKYEPKGYVYVFETTGSNMYPKITSPLFERVKFNNIYPSLRLSIDLYT